VTQAAHPFRWREVWWAVALMAIAVAMIPFADATWAALFPPLRRLGLAGWRPVFQLAENFPDPKVIVAACIAYLAWKRREGVPLVVALVATMIVGTIASNALKNSFSRARPYFGTMLYDIRDAEDSIENQKFIAEWNARHPGAPISMDARDKWLGATFPRPAFKVGFGSFPSAHARNAMAFAAFLALAVPRLSLLWIACGLLCAASRVYDGMHYPEDAIFGAGLGWLMMHAVASWEWPQRWFRAGAQRLPRRARAWLLGF
jgi:membrane-associated phospholipid phosphatase